MYVCACVCVYGSVRIFFVILQIQIFCSNRVVTRFAFFSGSVYFIFPTPRMWVVVKCLFDGCGDFVVDFSSFFFFSF